MSPFSILVALVIATVFSWGWFSNWFKPRPQVMDESRLQQELNAEGALKADGTVSVDKEFDTELNALIRDMNSAEKDGGAELDTIEKE